MTSKVQCIGGLPCGIYAIDSNGLVGYLILRSVDIHGNITGQLNRQNISGTWDPISKKITFSTTFDAGGSNLLTHKYTGFYHFLCIAQITTNCEIILGGSAIPMGIPSQQAAKQEFGWIAKFIAGY